MSHRLIETIEPFGPNGKAGRLAKVYRNAELGEYEVRLSLNGVPQPNATYFTNDRDDAHDTGVVMVTHRLLPHEKGEVRRMVAAGQLPGGALFNLGA